MNIMKDDGETSTCSCDRDKWIYFETLGILKEMEYVSAMNL